MSKISGDGNVDLSYTQGSHNVSCIDNRVNNHIDNSIHTTYNINGPKTQEQLERERSEMLNWISEQNFAVTQNDMFNRRADGTGIWLLEDPVFLEWFNGKWKVLCCYGIPGAGKSVLASVVINHLEKEFADDKTTAITYIYCNYKEQSQQTMENLIRNLLRQLLTMAVQKGLNKEYNDVLALYKEHKEKSRSLAQMECLRILKDIIFPAFTKVFIIVDAVDEIMDREREMLLGTLESFTKLSSIFVLILSRPIPEIKDYFSSSVQLEISAKESDLAAYLDGQLSSRNILAKQVRKNPTLGEEIKKGIIDKALGMFLLATFHLEAVATASTLKELRQHLQNLPKEVGDTYNNAMDRIRGSKWENLARSVLTWVIFSLRPLSITELQHALATDHTLATGEKIIDLEEDSLIFEDRILSVCAGLVILEDKSRIIKLVHYTAQEYFRRNGLQLPGPIPDAMITTTCITYLSQGHMIFARFLSDETQYNFLRYAAENWSHHARKALAQPQAECPLTELTKLEQQIVTFLRQHKVQESSATRRFWENNWTCWVQWEHQVEWDAPPLLVAIKFGLDKIVRILLQEERLLSLCKWWGSAVFHAATGGFGEILEMLLEAFVNSEAVGEPALASAIRGRNERIVRLLLDRGADTEYDGKLEPPLWIAAERGHEGIVQLLLDKGADTEVLGEEKSLFSSSKKGTSLWIAAKKGHEGIVRLLLDRGAKPEYDGKLEPPLWIAAERGHERIVQLLLDKGADTEVYGGKISFVSFSMITGTSLWIAVKKGHEGIVRLLLDRGAKTEYDGKLESPLWIAAKKGHERIVQLLLDKGADTEVLGEEKSFSSFSRITGTSLWIAVKKGHEGIVRLLLDRGAKTEYDGKLESPLSIAVEKGHEGIVQLLLDKGADTEYDGNWKPPLSIAAENGHEGVVRLLLDRGAKTEYDRKWEPPLSIAVEKGHEGIVQLLLNEGADTEYDGNWKPPLSIAAKNGHEGIMQLLLDRGAKTEYDGKWKPLSIAVEKGHERIVQLLLDKGADTDYDGKWKPLLSIAAENGHEGIVRLLLDRGAKTEYDGKWEPPLSIAAEKGHEGILQLLLDRGAKTEYDGKWESPLWIATKNGHEGIVRLLFGMVANTTVKHKIAICIAAASGNKDALQLLLDQGVDSDVEIWTMHKSTHTEVLGEGNNGEDKDSIYEGIPLWVATMNDHERVVQLLLDKGAHTEIFWEGLDMEGEDILHQVTPLWVAAMKGHKGIVQLLLDKGAYIEVFGLIKYSWNEDHIHQATPLWIAVMNGHEGIVQLLLDKGAHIEAFGLTKYSWNEDYIHQATPLWIATMNGYRGIVQLLLNKGAHTEGFGEGLNIEVEDILHQGTPLWVAAMKGHEGIVQLLLDKGAHTEAFGSGKGLSQNLMCQGTPLWIAAMNGNEGIVQLLLNKGAHTEGFGEGLDIEVEDILHQGTPLWVAAMKGHEGVVQLLLNKGAHTEVFGEGLDMKREDILHQGTSLWVAAMKGHKGIVQLLLDNGAHTEALGRESQHTNKVTPLCAAMKNGHESIVRLLLNKGADIQTFGVEVSSPLSSPTKSSDRQGILSNTGKGIVQLLLGKGAHTDAVFVGQSLYKDMYRTSLYIAAEQCNKDIEQLILDRGAVCCGKTLSAAAVGGNLRLVRMLLDQKKSDITVHGGIALYAAAFFGKTQVLHLLLERGAIVNTRVPGTFFFDDGDVAMTGSCTPLACAISKGHAELVDMLLQHGAAADDLDYEGLLQQAGLEFYISDAIRQLLREKLVTGEPGNVSKRKRGGVEEEEAEQRKRVRVMDEGEISIEEGKVDHSGQT